MFPEAVNRDLMRHEMKLADTTQLYRDKFGNVISGRVKKPTYYLDELQNSIYLARELSTKAVQKLWRRYNDDLLLLRSTEFGDMFYEFAVREMENKAEANKLFSEAAKDNDPIKKRQANTYRKRFADIKKRIDWDHTSTKEFTIGNKRMTGREIVSEIQRVQNKKNDQMHEYLTGDPDFIVQKFGIKNKKGSHIFIETGGGDKIPLINEKAFVKHLADNYRSGREIDIAKIGIDGMRRVIKSIQYQHVRKAENPIIIGNPEALAVPGKKGSWSYNLSRMFIEPTGRRDNYFPHMTSLFDRSVASADLKHQIQEIWNSPSLNRKEKIEKTSKLYFQTKQLMGDYVEFDQQNDAWNVISEGLVNIANKKSTAKHIKWFEQNQRVGSQFSRKNHVDGWSTMPEAYEAYMDSILKNFYRQASQVMSRSLIVDFRTRKIKELGKDKDTVNLIDNWVRYFQLYAQQAMGYPSIIPDNFYTDPKMKGLNIKGTLFSAFADNRVSDRMTNVAKRLGIVGRDLPNELKGLAKIDVQQIMHWSNLEARYALATLLAHPKSSIANLFGGSVHTVINTGWQNFKRARDINFIRSNIDENFKSMEDVNKWVRELGIIEEFILQEAGFNPKYSSRRYRNFIDDAVQAIKKDPKLPDVKLRELATKHGLTRKVFDLAAKFMSIPERALRRDAFVSHYIQAKEKFGGAITERDHPFLIEIAKKGVKATQFFYSAPFRPMFSATAVGKVFSRFQLWAWNSVKFRNEIIKNAAVKGIHPDSPEFSRFRRLAIADAYALALGSMFMYSLFGAQMPQPYAWFQDLADWMFGEDKDRERAFYGAYPTSLAPLQLITPPAFRFTGPILNGLVNGDWEKMSNYYVWTMFPFGRIARDVMGENGIVDNPFYALDKVTGIPMVSAYHYAKEREKKAEELPPSQLYQPPSVGFL